MNIEDIKKFLEEDDEGKALVEELKTPLLKKRDELLSDITALKAKYKDIDIDELTTKAALADTLQKKLDEASNADERFEQFKQSHEEQLALERQKTADLFGKYQNTKLDELITKTLSKHQGEPELLLHKIKNRIKTKLDEETATVSFEILTDDGKPMFVNGKEATLDDVVTELKAHPTYSMAFRGSGSSGSGTRGSTASTGGVVLDPSADGYSLSKAMEHAARKPSR